jgi:FlaA1/EpsC-like NDP-sugar epimerase
MSRDGDDGRRTLRLKVAIDLGVWTAAAPIAFVLRIPAHWSLLGRLIFLYTLTGIPIKLSFILFFRLDRQVWRRPTVEDLERVAQAVALGTAVMFMIGLAWSSMVVGFPRTVPLIEGALALTGLIANRGATRLLSERRSRRIEVASSGGSRRVLLVGAGSAGTQLGLEIRRHPKSGKRLVGFLDDDPSKRRHVIAGVQVLGGLEDLPRVAKQHQIDEVLITMPAAGGKVTRRVVEFARDVGVECRILPGLTQVLAGDIQLAGVRPVEVDDLLRRESVEFVLPAPYIEGRTVLVTGAGGSIGSELARQVARLDPRKMLLFGHGENTLHDIQLELRSTFPRLNFRVVMGDIRDRVKITHVLEANAPDVIFHAAAHKHVPLMEGDPDEAVLNNVEGTLNVAEAALAAGTERFVNVSTDKAVNPASMLGVTKALAERIVHMVAGCARPDQVFVSVRFGNVLGSRGSVVPIFMEQIRQGGPLLLTHPDATRYFMTISEASSLVIQAGALAVNGAVYVLDMGSPVRIVDLARDMIHLAGADDDEIRIAFTGLRPGEKLHEELFTEKERLATTRNEHIMMARHELTQEANARAEFEELISAAHSRDWQQMDRSLTFLLPDWRQGRAASLAARDDTIVVAEADEPTLDISSVQDGSGALTRPGQAESKAS